MPCLDIAGDKLHFSEQGAGVPIVFIHGSCGGGGQWKGLSKALAKDFRTICPDLFGSGKSEPWPLERPWSVADDERAINAILDHLGGPAHFVIHSAGGHFAYPVIKDRQDQVLSLTLFEPVYFHLLRQDGDDLFNQPQDMADGYRAAIDDGDRDKAMVVFVDGWAGRKGAWGELPTGVQEKMKIGANRLYHEWQTIWCSEPSRNDLAQLDLPTLLFKGSGTIASMHQVCEIVESNLPNCRRVEIDGAGHMSPFTHASIALPQIEAHLAACSR